ncbi:MAG: glycosyltransferase [Bacteroidota bacterium]|nr:glycosyltransferase [Bacteroidota bacterium]
MNTSKVSIITPSYNSESFIAQTIDSVLSQRYANCEYIIIDGGSTDGTVEIIKKYEKHLHYWVSEPDKGQSHAINKGFKKSTGDIINWLNADDYYEKDSLYKVAHYFEDPSINCFCGRSNIVDVSGAYLHQSSGTDIYPNNIAKTIGWARIDQPETYFRNIVFEKLGGVNENLHYVMDKEFWIRYLLAYGLEGIKIVNDTLVNFRLHDQSKTGSNPLKFQEETNKLFHSLAISVGLSFDYNPVNDMEQLPGIKWPSQDANLINNVLQYYYLYLADFHYYTGNRKFCDLLLQKIEENNLEKVDLALYKKLKFRNKYLPGFVQKMKFKF